MDILPTSYYSGRKRSRRTFPKRRVRTLNARAWPMPDMIRGRGAVALIRQSVPAKAPVRRPAWLRFSTAKKSQPVRRPPRSLKSLMPPYRGSIQHSSPSGETTQSSKQRRAPASQVPRRTQRRVSSRQPVRAIQSSSRDIVGQAAQRTHLPRPDRAAYTIKQLSRDQMLVTPAAPEQLSAPILHGQKNKELPDILFSALPSSKITADSFQLDKPLRAEVIVLPQGWLINVSKAILAWRHAFSFRGRAVLMNGAVLALGCLLLVGLLSQLQEISFLMDRFDLIRSRAGQAYERLAAAQAALATTDFAVSEHEFAEAAELLRDAQREMDEALSSSKLILHHIDVTGTVQSGQELLTAGAELTLAGEQISRGAGSIVPQPLTDTSDQTLVDGLLAARHELEAAVVHLTSAEAALAKVSSPLLPAEIAEQAGQLKEQVPVIRDALTAFLEQGDAVLTILGAERERQYLLLFQNNHELRPTGGFIGSIGLIDIDRGRVENIDVQSVYNPDGQLRDYIAPPNPLWPIANRWYLRDANWFIDFPLSAQKAAEFFEKEGGPTVDGVIALTPEVVRELLTITGPIDVPNYNVTVSYDTFWEITQHQVSYAYDRELNRPKQFLADLTPLILNRLFEAPPSSALPVLEVFTKLTKQKHLLVYFKDDDVQQRFQEMGWTGSFPRDQRGLVAVNNANIAGHKSDQFIDQDIDYQLRVSEAGDVDVFLTIRRTHNGPTEAGTYQFPENENPATKDNIVYQRVLVPREAELISAEGFALESAIPRFVEPEFDLPLIPDPDIVEWQRSQHEHASGTIVGEEAGAQFFANWQVTSPGETSIGLYHYRLPHYASLPTVFDPAERFEALVVKQPGDMRSTVRVSIELPEVLRSIKVVPDHGLTQPSDHEIVYRGALDHDVLVGTVFEKR